MRVRGPDSDGGDVLSHSRQCGDAAPSAGWTRAARRAGQLARPHAGASPQVGNDAFRSLRVDGVAGMELRKSGFLDARLAIEDDGERDEDDPPPRRRVADTKAE